jgi:hypothetical protein
MADEIESSVTETIAKALWLSSMRGINSVAAGESNLTPGNTVSGPLPGSPCRKIKMYSKQGSFFVYEPHREWK